MDASREKVEPGQFMTHVNLLSWGHIHWDLGAFFNKFVGMVRQALLSACTQG
jgi:hypothetical protein